MKMGKALKVLLGLLAVIVIVVIWAFFYITGIYNDMVAKDEGVKTAWSQVENQYQRRIDLIPNLVSTVKGYSIHEAGTLEAVVEARAKATQTQVNVADANTFSQFQASQDGLTAALGKLMVVVEQYPDLKADKNFLELQAQLEGTENRISVERKNFNESVKDYNIFIRQFPQNFIAGMFKFELANLFENQPGAETVPVVDFS
jgi:LemA protein